jgi:uncharacterized protein
MRPGPSPADAGPSLTGTATRPKEGPIAIGGGALLDPRRAIWVPSERVLAVADLHLGYAWEQRRRGLLLPVEGAEDTLARLQVLVREYQPRHLVVLGDIVHRVAQIPMLESLLSDLCRQLARECDLVFCRGNHDGRLETIIGSQALPVRLVDEWQTGCWRWTHGDRPEPLTTLRLESGPLTVVMGHEHPCLRLHDGVTSTVKVPCFLVSERLVILPAFSNWAAGSIIGQRAFMGSRAQEASFQSVFACIGHRLLEMPWAAALRAGQSIR